MEERREGDARPIDNRRGILLIIGACFLLAVNDVTTKIAALSLAPGEVLFLRNLVALLCLCGFVLVQWNPLPLKAALASPPVLFRALFEALSHGLFVILLVRMPVAELGALSLLSPLLLVVILFLFFREPIGWRRWLAVGAGFAGALLIVRPAFGAFNPWAPVAVFVALCAALRDLMTRYIPGDIPSMAVAIIATVAIGAGGLVMAGAEAWSLPSPESAAVVAVAGIALSGGTYLGIAAFRNVEIAAIAPFRYTTLLWSAIGAFLLLGEVPGLLSIAGAGLIVGSGIYSIHREVDAARRRAGRAAPVTP